MKAKSKKQTKRKFHKGDEVMIMVGRSKGETGKIDKIDFKNSRVFISGKNLGKRHTKPDLNNEGGIVDKPMPLHISNIMVMDPKEKKPTRIGFKVTDGKKTRVSKVSGSVIEN